MASQKLSPWKKQTSSYLLFDFLFFWKTALFIFQLSSYFSHFMCVFLLFSFFCSVFSGVFIFFLRFSNPKKHEKSLSRKYLFLQTFSFWTFFWREKCLNIFCSKIIIWNFLPKKKNFSKKKKKKRFSLFTCVEERIHAWRLSWPLLRLVA